MLVDQALPSSAQYQDTLHQMTSYFVGQGGPLIEAQHQTIAQIGQQVQLQALLLAYMDAFWVLTLVALASWTVLPCSVAFQPRRWRSTCILARNATSGWVPIATIARVSSAINAARCTAVKRKRSA
jgi:hypothetical protein